MFGGEAEQGIFDVGAEDAQGFLMQVRSFLHDGREGGFATKPVQPGIADESLIAEEAVVHGTLKHFEGPVVSTEMAQLASLVVRTLRIAERGAHEFAAGLKTFLAVPFQQGAHGSEEELAQAPGAGIFLLAEHYDGFRSAIEQRHSQSSAIAEVLLRGLQGAFIVAEHEIGVIERSGHLGIETARFVMREKGGLQETAVAADVG